MAKVRKIRKLNLNPNEMAFRKIERSLLERGKISTVFRPGQRVCGTYRSYCPGQNAHAKILDRIGADWAMIAPSFIKGFSKKITIKTVEIKKIRALRPSDFKGAAPAILDKRSLIYYLGIIYNLSEDELAPDSLITKITFTYDEK